MILSYLILYICIFVISLCYWIFAINKNNAFTLTIFTIVIATGIMILSNFCTIEKQLLKYFFCYLVILAIITGSQGTRGIVFHTEYFISVFMFVLLLSLDLCLKKYVNMYYPFLPILYIVFLLFNAFLRGVEKKYYYHAVSALLFSAGFLLILYNSIVLWKKEFVCPGCYVFVLLGLSFFIIGSVEKRKLNQYSKIKEGIEKWHSTS